MLPPLPSGLARSDWTPVCFHLQLAAKYGYEAEAQGAEAEAEAGCSLRLVLLPFGSNKAELDDYKVRS